MGLRCFMRKNRGTRNSHFRGKKKVSRDPLPGEARRYQELLNLRIRNSRVLDVFTLK
jgi:hypothetical protein